MKEDTKEFLYFGLALYLGTALIITVCVSLAYLFKTL